MKFPITRIGRSFFTILGIAALLLLARVPTEAASSTATVLFVHGESGGRSASDTGEYTASETFFDPATGYYGHGSASVSFTPGDLPMLHADAVAPTGPEESTSANDVFDDWLDFEAGPNSSSAIFKLNFLVDGSLTGSSSGFFSVSWNGVEEDYQLGQGTQEYQFAITGSDLEVDGPGDIGGRLIIELGAGANSSLGGEANYSNTAKLTEADVTDAGGDPVAGVFFDTDGEGGTPGSVLFASNTPLAAPEPATWMLLVPGLGLFAIWLQRRRALA